MEGIGLILFLLAGFGYIIPGVVASSRNKRNAGAIWTLNILLGWTLLGWVGALVWAMTHDVVVVDAASTPTPDPVKENTIPPEVDVYVSPVPKNKVCPG